MKKVIFLDRDGVINKDSFGISPTNYVQSWDYFKFADKAKEGLKTLTEKGFDIIVISNQAGVAKGHYSKETLQEMTEKMISEIEQAGGKIKKVFYCMHQDSDNCDCRKPKTGLFKQAQEFLGSDIKGSYFVGDTERDVVAGHCYGLKVIAVLTGKNNEIDVSNWKEKPEVICKDLVEVANLFDGNC